MTTLKTMTIAVITWAAFMTCKATMDTNQLAGIIFQNLTNDCPTIEKETLSGWKGYIAAQAGGATNFDTLNTNLQTIFSTDKQLRWLDWTNNSALLTVAAAAIALEEFPPAGIKPVKPLPPVHLKDASSNSWGKILLWTGAKLENPYTINPSTKTLQSAGSSSQPYIEIGFNERYVLRSGEYNDLLFAWERHGQTPNDGSAHWVRFWEKVPDVEGSFGYIFPGNSNSTNYSISTIVGSSDIYADASMGLPILRYCSADYSFKQQVTFEINGGFATDKNFLTIHPSVFLGFGYQGKFPNFIGSTNLPMYWSGRAGCAMIDEPKLIGTNVVFNTPGGFLEPAFENKWVPALGVSVIIPVTSALSLQAGGNAYFSEAPASWNLTLGVTLDLSKLSKGLGTVLGLQ
jgi:hypothetical protein